MGGIEHFQSSIRYLEEAQAVFLLGSTWAGLGCSNNLLGEFETARNQIEKALKIDMDIGMPISLSMYYWMLSMVQFDLGDLKKAKNSAEKGLELAQKYKQRHHEGFSNIMMGKAQAKANISQSAEVKELILEGIQILEKLEMRVWFSQGYLFLGELYTDIGQKEKAQIYLKKAETEFKDMDMDYWLGRTNAAYAELHKREGEAPKTADLLNKAIEIMRECGANGWVEKYEKELAVIS